MFLSAVWTLSLRAPIKCRGSIGEQVMQCKISQLSLQIVIIGLFIPLIKETKSPKIKSCSKMLGEMLWLRVDVVKHWASVYLSWMSAGNLPGIPGPSAQSLGWSDSVGVEVRDRTRHGTNLSTKQDVWCGVRRYERKDTVDVFSCTDCYQCMWEKSKPLHTLINGLLILLLIWCLCLIGVCSHL